MLLAVGLLEQDNGFFERRNPVLALQMANHAQPLDAARHANRVGMGHGGLNFHAFFNQALHGREVAAIVKHFGQGVEALDVAGGIGDARGQVEGGSNSGLGVVEPGNALLPLRFRQLQLQPDAGGGRTGAVAAFLDGRLRGMSRLRQNCGL